MREVKDKPLVLIKDAYIDKSFHKGEGDILAGIPFNHPNEWLNGKLIYSSPIIKVEGDIVETKNTKYVVSNWKSQKTLLRSNKDGD